MVAGQLLPIPSPPLTPAFTDALQLSKPRPSVHGRSWQCLFVPTLQTYKDSDIDVFTFGTPINTISLATILLHQAMEMKTWVSAPKLFGPKNCVPVHRLHSDSSCFSLYHWSTEYTHAELIPMVYFDKDKEVEKIKLLAQLAHHLVRMKKLRHIIQWGSILPKQVLSISKFMGVWRQEKHLTDHTWGNVREVCYPFNWGVKD